MKCPVCGAENPENANYCNLCLARLGFEDLEYPSANDSVEGYMNQYPSSFDEPEGLTEAAGGYQPDPGTECAPAAGPVEIGEYGVRSGEQVYPDYQADQYGEPVDIGTYGQQSGLPPGGYPPGWAETPAYGEAVRERRFDWGKAILLCVYTSLAAALVSVSLELMLGLAGVTIMMGGEVTKGYLVILGAILVGAAICGYYPAYRMEKHGPLLGVIAVALWAFLWRPLYYAVLGWMLSSKFTFTASFNMYSLAFIIFLFLPVGAILGWISEKRVTTGLKI